METPLVQWFDNVFTRKNIVFDFQQRQKTYQRDLHHDTNNTVMNGSHTTTSEMMQLNMNPREVCRIVGCNIIYVMFLVVYNITIDKSLDKLIR